MAINHKEHNQSKGMSKRLARAEKVLRIQPRPGRVPAHTRGVAAAAFQQLAHVYDVLAQTPTDYRHTRTMVKEHCVSMKTRGPG